MYLFRVCVKVMKKQLFEKIWRTVTASMTNFPFYKTNFPFYKTKLRIMIVTFHILKLSSYHNINIYILLLLFFHNIKVNCYYKTKLLIIILTSLL